MKVVLLFLFIFHLSKSTLANECIVPKHPKEVNLFFDFNASWREVEVATREACKQGKAIRVIPDWSERESFSKHAEELTRLELDLKSCRNRQCMTDRESKMAFLVKKMEKFKAPKIDSSLIEKSLDKIKEEYPHTDIGRLLISGHDGGGNFNGHNGELDRQEIYEVFDKHPELRKSVRGIYLLGCNSGTTMELSLWGSIFPEAIFVNGYEGQAPLNFRAKGLEYLESLMQKEEEIISSKTKKEVEQRLLQVARIREGFTGLRLVCPGINNEDGSQVELNAFGIPLDKGSFMRTDPTAGCHSEAFEENYRSFLSYYHGNTPIPQDSGPSSAVRGIYNFASSNAHCMDFQDEFKIPINMTFGLNFFHAFKKNALRASDNYKASLRDDITMDIDQLYDEYDSFHEKMRKRRDHMVKAHEILKEILRDKGGSFSNEQLWEIVDQLESSWASDFDTSAEKKLLVENLKVALWNSSSDRMSKTELLGKFQIKGSLKKPSRSEFKRKYENAIEEINELSRAFFETIPEEDSKLLNSGPSSSKLISQATRKEILQDFTIRNKKFLDTREQASNLLLGRLGGGEDPYLSMIVERAFSIHDKTSAAFEAYQNGAVDLNCVPFSWHEELEKGDSALKGDPCQQRQM